MFPRTVASPCKSYTIPTNPHFTIKVLLHQTLEYPCQLLSLSSVLGPIYTSQAWQSTWFNCRGAWSTDQFSIPMELTEVERDVRSSIGAGSDSIKDEDEEAQLQWAAIERLPTFRRLRTSLFDLGDSENGKSSGKESAGKKVVDVTKLGADERHLFIEKIIKHIEHDNLRLLQKMRERIDR